MLRRTMTRNRSHAENAMHVLPENHISRSICWHAFNDLYFLPNADAKRSYFLMYLFHCRENFNANAPKKFQIQFLIIFRFTKNEGENSLARSAKKHFLQERRSINTLWLVITKKCHNLAQKFKNPIATIFQKWYWMKINLCKKMCISKLRF